MRYLGQDDLTEMMGIGYPGEIRVGPDGSQYQWVEGIDGLGNPIGFWKRIVRSVRRVAAPVVRMATRPVRMAYRTARDIIRYARKPWCIPLRRVPGSVKGAARRVCGVVGRLRPLAYVPVVGSYYRGIARLCNIARGCGIAGLEGGLMQAPDGRLYQVQGLGQDEGLYGLAEDEELYGLGQDDLTEMMGIGYLGQIRTGPDGNQYQWVEGIDGLGNPFRFWRCRTCVPSRRRRIARGPGRLRLPGLRLSPGRGRLRLPRMRPITSQARRLGQAGLGNLYQAPDGMVYQLQGLAEDEELYGLGQDEDLYGLAEDEDLYGLAQDEELYGLGQDEELYGLAEDEDLYGLAQDEELYGLAEDEDLYGLAQDEELYGLGEDEELYGLAQDEDLYGLAEDEDLYGLAQDEELYGVGQDEELYGLAEDEELYGMDGYVREKGVNGLGAFVPDKPAGTRKFVRPAQPPDLWRPLW